MKIQTCDSSGVKTFTDITNEKEILTMEDYYRDYMLTNEDDMPSCIDGYLLDHDKDTWYIFDSNNMYEYSCTIDRYYQDTLNELNYIQLVMKNIKYDD